MQLQAAYRAASQNPSGVADDDDGAVSATGTGTTGTTSTPAQPTLKSALKKPDPAAQAAKKTNMRDFFGLRASSNPDVKSLTTTAQTTTTNNTTTATTTTTVNTTATTAPFGATKTDILASYKHQALLGKADFFLASASKREREQKARLAAKLNADVSAIERTAAQAQAQALAHAHAQAQAQALALSHASSSPIDPENAALNSSQKTIRFADDSHVSIADSSPSASSLPSTKHDKLIQQQPLPRRDLYQVQIYHQPELVQPRKTVNFNGSFRSDVIIGEDDDEYDDDDDDEEMDLVVTQQERVTKLSYDDDSSDNSSDDNDEDAYGFSGGISIIKAAFAAHGIAAIPSYTHASSIGLQRTPSAEKGLNKLSSLSSSNGHSSSSIASQSVISPQSSGGLQRTSSFEKGLSKLQRLHQ
ncbi:hypothetical protein HK100_005183 [Physocladia obscura]|uniref:Uncharacterized protein n=1 Tax=Physocladia obscura TaxID=109957 RepID=A0AAD5XKQ2_9FUNG|nr:hypothetical protein HK100_005183 [Physocladia obscura]